MRPKASVAYLEFVESLMHRWAKNLPFPSLEKEGLSTTRENSLFAKRGIKGDFGVSGAAAIDCIS
jgi:hypothetical protein